MLVRDIMTNDFISIPNNSMIMNAAQQMRDQDIGMLPVEKNGKIIGAVTDRGITVRAIANGDDPDNTPVENIISKQIFTGNEETDLQEAAQIMEEHQCPSPDGTK